MLVKELIHKLSFADPEAIVMVYCREDFNKAKKITTKENSVSFEQGLYCQGYSFKELQKDDPNLNYIVIGD